MKLLLLLLLISSTTAFAQKKPSQSDINKARQMQAEMQKQMDKQLKELEATNPEKAKVIREMMKKGVQNGDNNTTESDDESITYPTKPPAKDARLTSISTKVLSPQELVVFVKGLSGRLEQQLSAQEKNKFLQALTSLQNDAAKMEDAAIINWIKKSPQGALLFALKAVETNPDEPMYGNNLGALLIQTKKEDKAIPLLITVLQKHPQSAMVLNNLGQAYFGLGDLITAKSYFEKCLLLTPTHPEANHSMGLIYRFIGNAAKSDYYFEQELKVRFNKTVYNLLKSHNSKNLSNALQARWTTPPNYFHQLGLDRIKVPKIPRSVSESNEVYMAHKQFQMQMQDEIQKIAASDAALVRQKFASRKSDKNIHSELITTLLQDFEKLKEKQLSWIGELSDDVVREFPTRGNPTKKEWKDIAAQYSKLEEEISKQKNREDSIAYAQYAANKNSNIDQLQATLKEIELKYCQRLTSTADNYLPQFAELQSGGFQDHADLFPPLINEAFYYSSLSPDNAEALSNAHSLIQSYLSFLQAYSALTVIANTKANNYQGQGYINIHCDVAALLAEQSDYSQLNDVTPSCAFKIVVPLVVAKVSFDCTSVGVEGGEGVIVGAQYEFKTGNTTLSIGAGIETNVPFISAGATQQAYVTFDNNGNYSDAGIKGQIGAEIGGYGPTVTTSAGYQIGINAGASASIEDAGNSTTINF